MNNNELRVLDSALFDEPLWVLTRMVCDNIETVEEFCSILVKLTNSEYLTCKSDDLLDPPITEKNPLTMEQLLKYFGDKKLNEVEKYPDYDYYFETTKKGNEALDAAGVEFD